MDWDSFWLGEFVVGCPRCSGCNKDQSDPWKNDWGSLSLSKLREHQQLVASENREPSTIRTGWFSSSSSLSLAYLSVSVARQNLTNISTNYIPIWKVEICGAGSLIESLTSTSRSHSSARQTTLLQRIRSTCSPTLLIALSLKFLVLTRHSVQNQNETVTLEMISRSL